MGKTYEIAKEMISLYHETAEKCIDELGTEWHVADSDSIYYDEVFYNLRTMLIKIESELLNEKIEQAKDFMEKLDDRFTDVQSTVFEYRFKYVDSYERIEVRNSADYSDYAESVSNILVSELSDEKIERIFLRSDLVQFLHEYIKHDLELNEYNSCLYNFDSDLDVDERESLSMRLISSAIEKLDELYNKIKN